MDLCGRHAAGAATSSWEAGESFMEDLGLKLTLKEEYNFLNMVGREELEQGRIWVNGTKRPRYTI